MIWKVLIGQTNVGTNILNGITYSKYLLMFWLRHVV